MEAWSEIQLSNDMEPRIGGRSAATDWILRIWAQTDRRTRYLISKIFLVENYSKLNQR